MRGVVGSEYDSRTSLLSSYPGSVTFFLTFFFLFIISFFAHELFMWPIYRPVACNELKKNKKEKKGKATHPTMAQTNKHIIARDTWMPSLENWEMLAGTCKLVYTYYVHVHV